MPCPSIGRVWAYLDDLSACIVSNNTTEPFVTSDDPVVLTNRFYFQRLNSNAFGIANSGALVLTPLAPQLYFLLWDSDCYSIPARSGPILRINNIHDVQALNGLQYQRAASNIYVSDDKHAKHVALACEALGERSPPFRLYTMVEDGSDGEHGQRFKAVEPEVAKQSGSFMVLTQPNYPKPLVWPSFLKWRFKIRSHNDGSAAGHVRLGHPALARRKGRAPLGIKRLPRAR